jgi:arylformamidase
VVPRIHDVTVPLRPGMVTYPGDPPVVVERVASMAAGDAYNLSRLELGAHTGTHVDAPLHFVDGGAGVDALLLDALIGPAQVLAWDGDGDVGSVALDGLAAGVERVLFKTRNSGLWALKEFAEEHVGVAVETAERLVAAGVRLVGIDYLSVGGHETHRVLLGAGAVVLEGLDLREVEPGRYTLVCLPLRLVGADGAPARAVLVRDVPA